MHLTVECYFIGHDNIQALFFVHLVFPTWSLQYNWAPSSYFFYNLIFLVVLVWTMHQTESVQAVIVVS